MKNVKLFAALLPVMFMALGSCTSKSSNKKSILTPTATGAPYEMLVVADPEDFQNGVYDALHEVLTDDILCFFSRSGPGWCGGSSVAGFLYMCNPWRPLLRRLSGRGLLRDPSLLHVVQNLYNCRFHRSLSPQRRHC